MEQRDGDSAVISEEQTPTVRNLYVPYMESMGDGGKLIYQTVISWDSQRDAAYRHFANGETVHIHRHGHGSSCLPADSPVGGCVRIGLTDDGEPGTILLVGEEAGTEVPDSEQVGAGAS